MTLAHRPRRPPSSRVLLGARAVRVGDDDPHESWPVRGGEKMGPQGHWASAGMTSGRSLSAEPRWGRRNWRRDEANPIRSWCPTSRSRLRHCGARRLIANTLGVRGLDTRHPADGARGHASGRHCWHRRA